MKVKGVTDFFFYAFKMIHARVSHTLSSYRSDIALNSPVKVFGGPSANSQAQEESILEMRRDGPSVMSEGSRTRPSLLVRSGFQPRGT